MVRQLNEMYYNIAAKHLGVNKETSEPSYNIETPHAKFRPGEYGTPTEEDFLGNNSDNMTYTVYNFGDMRVLVRCRIHGYCYEAQQNPLHSYSSALAPSSANRKKRFVGTKCKLDYPIDIEGINFHPYILPNSSSTPP